MSTSAKKTIPIVLIISALIMLPSCGLIDWLKEKFGGGSPGGSTSQMATMAPQKGSAEQDSSPVLATIDGKPLITKNMLDGEKRKLLESNPQLQAMVALMDEKQLERNLIDGMTSREIIRKYVADNNIDTNDKYKKDLEMVMGQVKDALNTRYFMEAFPVAVNESEVKKFYDDNKEAIPNLLLSRGGVETVGTSFNSEIQAKEFASKVRTNKNDMMRVAREGGIASRVKDFKLVNDQSIGIDPELRDKVIEIKSTPSVHTFKVGNDYWVVAANKLEKPQYRELDQVKDEIRQLLEKDKTMKKFEEEVARLRNEYHIELNEEFFGGNTDNARAVQAELEESNQPNASNVKSAAMEQQKANKVKTSVV